MFEVGLCSLEGEMITIKKIETETICERCREKKATYKIQIINKHTGYLCDLCSENFRKDPRFRAFIQSEN